MSELEPDYARLSVDELLDVAAHIDRQRFPERWQRLAFEIQSRAGRAPEESRVAGAPSESPNLNPELREKRPPMSRRNAIIFVSCICAIGLAFMIFAAVRLFQSHFWRGPDAQFGDQHLKTAVALIELHRIRFGRYPDQLSDLHFVGDWDHIALNSISYFPSPDRLHYCVQVERGWIGKPKLNMPPEFWRGTGYDAKLCR